MRIGKLAYLNALPFYLPFERKILSLSADWIKGSPAVLNQQIKNEALDLALISSMAYLRDPDHYTLLSPFCIASEGAVLSVLLLSRVPPESLSHKKIGLTTQSETSVALLKVICNHFWKVSPNYAPLPSAQALEAFDAVLLIGDEALKYRQTAGFQTIDLGKVWQRETDYGFPFALLVARAAYAHTYPSNLLIAEKAFHKALAWSKQHANEIIAVAAERSALPIELLAQYYKHLYYEIDQSKQSGLDLFRQFVKKDQL